MAFKRWETAPLDKDSAAALAEACGLHPFLALMLSQRGVETAEDAEAFLLGGELQDDPFGFQDMDAAVERIQRAIDNGERIAVFGEC
jgi:single-stranded-DNA-specific exonuclease